MHTQPAISGVASRTATTCTSYWPHGVGRKHAHDHTSGTPVTNFKRSNRIYANAMDHNPDLDRDNDKIACEAA
jgi:hypothetical protein